MHIDDNQLNYKGIKFPKIKKVLKIKIKSIVIQAWAIQ
jgi:hypothetical protein